MPFLKVSGMIFVVAICLATAQLASREWNLRRNSSNGACSVQPVDSQPQLGQFLATFPTRKAACEDAKARHSEDAGDTNKCFTYTSGTKDECQKDGVDLED
jgi:hypothetical protein